MRQCPYCALPHAGVCSMVAAINYRPDGSVERVEFHEPKAYPSVMGFQLPKAKDDDE